MKDRCRAINSQLKRSNLGVDKVDTSTILLHSAELIDGARLEHNRGKNGIGKQEFPTVDSLGAWIKYFAIELS